MKNLFYIAFFAFFSIPAMAQPFGVKPTDNPTIKSDYMECEQVGNDGYFCESVPKPHPMLSDYALFYHPKFGIISIFGRSSNFILDDMHQVYEQLQLKYGDHSEYEDNTYTWILENNEHEIIEIHLYPSENSFTVSFMFAKFDDYYEWREAEKERNRKIQNERQAESF